MAAPLVFVGGDNCCRRTAEILCPKSLIAVEGGLQEFDYGVFAGKSEEELQEDPAYEKWTQSEPLETCPGGEDPYQFLVRCTWSFRKIVEEVAAKGIEAVALICHNNVIGAILRHYCVPCFEYRDWTLKPAKGYLTEYSTRTRTLILRNSI